MRNRYQFDSKPGTYFITSTIVGYIPVFTAEKYFMVLIDSFRFFQKNRNVKIFCWVIMDNHFHMVIYGDNLSIKLSALKSYTAQKIIKYAKEDSKKWLLSQFKYYKKSYKNNIQHQVWQEGVHPQLIETEDVATQKINYIHNNPVKRGLVEKPEYWKYSSANENNLIELDNLELY